jgi:hypothetical protein
VVEVTTTRMIDGSYKRINIWDDASKYVAPHGFGSFFCSCKIG